MGRSPANNGARASGPQMRDLLRGKDQQPRTLAEQPGPRPWPWGQAAPRTGGWPSRGARPGATLRAMDPALRANRDLWDAWTKINVGSAFYDVASFPSGEHGVRISDYELEEVGSVEGKTL